MLMVSKLAGNGDYRIFLSSLSAYYNLEAQSENSAFVEWYRGLLHQVFSNDSILQLVPYTTIPLLQAYSTGGAPDHRLQPLIPALGLLFQESDGEEPIPELRNLCGTLDNQAQSLYNELVDSRKTIKETKEPPPVTSERHWEETGCYYGRPPLWYRPFYEGRDDENTFNGAGQIESCRKFYSTYSKTNLTSGLMGLWCPHLVCLGFQMIPHAEGRNDVFSALWVYFEKAPRTVVYDFACQLP